MATNTAAPMPDSLVGGFDAGYIGRLQGQMDSDALGQLSYVHKTAGTLFPLIFGFTWLLLIGTNVERKALRWALWALPMLFVVVRLCGNVAGGTWVTTPPLPIPEFILAAFSNPPASQGSSAAKSES